MAKTESLGDRMKEYEAVNKTYLMGRCPVLLRLDGKAFHTFTRGFDRPYDKVLAAAMWETAKYLCANIMGCKLAYTQSDEITLLLIDYETHNSDAWFDNNVQKMVSVSASMATLAFNKAFNEAVAQVVNVRRVYDNLEMRALANRYRKAVTNGALFDSRAFCVPREEVTNAFIWRQQDATRNAIEAAGRAQFAHKDLHGVSGSQVQEMLFQECGINFNDYPVAQKRGACIIKEYYDKDGTQRSRWVVDENIPIFTQDRDYIERFLYLDKVAADTIDEVVDEVVDEDLEQ